jgi:hypothetical protein
MEARYAPLEAGYESVKSHSANVDKDFDCKMLSIWHKVELLEQVKYIENEKEKFSVACRFMEIELEKAFKERESLKQSLLAVIQAFNR